MRYRIALCGFSEFEYRAMHFSFQHPASSQETGFDVVGSLAEADFAVVDADSKPAVKGVVQSGRVAHSVFVGASPPAGAIAHLPRPIDPTRILRMLDELIASHAPTVPAPVPASPPRAEPSGWQDLPTLDSVVFAPVPEPEPAPPTVPRSNAKKAAARAAARRARLAQNPSEAPAAEPLRDVLVLDPDGVTGMVLCALVERFGFLAHSAATIPQAEEHLAIRPFAAVFLDMALDGAGLALLEHIREIPPPPGYAAPAVLLVRAHLDPADRVRAVLAGIGEPLIKPVSRGNVARALESFGVVFPADARRG